MIRMQFPIEGVQSAQGLDVSNFQGRFNWRGAVRSAPLAFGIFRLTEGLPQSQDNSPDPDAVWNHAEIRDAGLTRGAYHFLHPSLSGAAQAQYFVEMHDKLGFRADDMLWLDNETTDGLPANEVAACAGDFMDELRKLRPHNPMGVYTYISFAHAGNCAGLEKWPLWLAFPSTIAPPAPAPFSKWTFWQWGARDGTDADAFNGTAADFEAWIDSFAPAPSAGPYAHHADGVTPWGTYAALRGMKGTSFFNEQLKIDPANAASFIDTMTPEEGSVFYTLRP